MAEPVAFAELADSISLIEFSTPSAIPKAPRPSTTPSITPQGSTKTHPTAAAPPRATVPGPKLVVSAPQPPNSHPGPPGSPRAAAIPQLPRGCAAGKPRLSRKLPESFPQLGSRCRGPLLPQMNHGLHHFRHLGRRARQGRRRRSIQKWGRSRRSPAKMDRSHRHHHRRRHSHRRRRQSPDNFGLC